MRATDIRRKTRALARAGASHDQLAAIAPPRKKEMPQIEIEMVFVTERWIELVARLNDPCRAPGLPGRVIKFVRCAASGERIARDAGRGHGRSAASKAT
jgi:hypothetical protein